MSGRFRIAYALSLHTETSDETSSVLGVNNGVAGELFVAVLSCDSYEPPAGGERPTSASSIKTLVSQQTLQLSSMPFGNVQSRCIASEPPPQRVHPSPKKGAPAVSDDATSKSVNFVLHVEYVASGVPERTVVFQTTQHSTVDDKATSGSFHFQLPKAACTESLLLTAGSHTVIDVCIGWGVQSVPPSDSRNASSSLIGAEVFASAVQGHHTSFREHIVQARYRALKQCFATAVDDVLVLEMKLDSAMYELNAMVAAAACAAPLHTVEPLADDVKESPRPGTSLSGDAAAVRPSSPNGGGNVETRRLRSLLQAKESELVILRARVAAIEDTRRAELQSMREQLSRFKVKRREIVDKGRATQRGRSKTPPAGGHHGAKDAKHVGSNTEAAATATANGPSATLASTSNAVLKQPATAADPASRNSSRQVSPAFRQQSPLRSAKAVASQRPQPTSLSRGATAVQKCETDHKDRLQRIEESFSRLQSRQPGGQVPSTNRSTSNEIGYQPVPTYRPATSGPNGRSVSPLHVPDVQTVRVRNTTFSPSASENRALKVSSPARGVDSFQSQPSTKSNVTNTTTQRGGSPTAANSLLRISPGRVNVVLSTADQKPPMQRR